MYRSILYHMRCTIGCWLRWWQWRIFYDKKCPPSGIINPDLSGKFLFEHEDNAWVMDVSTGSYSKIPNTLWSTHENIFGYAQRFYLYTVRNTNQQFIVTSLDDCTTKGSHTNEVCVAIQNFSGNYLANFLFYENSRSPA
jgi:hypothetical protein